MRTDRLRLLDATEQAEMISKFSERGREAFIGDALVQSAVLHCLALRGEACRGVSDEDLEPVWTIVIEHDPALGAQLRGIVDSLPE